MGGLDHWIQHSYPSSRVITINKTGMPSRISPTTISSTKSYNTTSTDYSPGSYSTVQDDKFHPEYEDVDNFYEKPPIIVEKKNSLNASPPPLPPLNQTMLQKLVEDYTIQKSKKLSKNSNVKWTTVFAGFVLFSAIACLFFVIFFLQNSTTVQKTDEKMEDHSSSAASVLEKKSLKKFTEPLISANTLLTYLITKKDICLFEVTTLQTEQSRTDFESEHIKSAQLLIFNNLSHSGVPVHPLQFQRYIRNLGVNQDCHIIVYDKGEQIWASYALWIFKLFGHERVSLLNGGFPEWKTLQLAQSGPYPTELGPGSFTEVVGDFQARWTAEYVSAFDDVMANFENKECDIVDAQSPEEYEGTAPGAVFGHIKTAVNIPPEEVFDGSNNTWLDKANMSQIFANHGLQITRPIIVYCGTSLHASMIWLALHRLKFNATVYFGSWPEWVIRAPDNLKVIPESIQNLPSSKENLRTTAGLLQLVKNSTIKNLN